VHVLIGVMHQGSGLLGTGAEMGLAMSHVFPPKDLMDEHAYTGIEMSVSPLPVYRKLTYLVVEAP